MSKSIKVPSEVFSRVSGYFRPVNQWNNGKREEFSQRIYADIRKAVPEVSLNVSAARGATS